MRLTAIAVFMALAFACGSMASKPNRAMVEAMEKSMDRKMTVLWPGDPAEVMGLTQGVYITGYGAVFMSEVNLAPAAGITPFHPQASQEEIKRTHEKKVSRMAKLRDAMQGMLVDSAKSLDAVPADEQVVLGVSLFYWNWEDKSGMPAQIVMHAPKRVLLQADKASIVIEEF